MVKILGAGVVVQIVACAVVGMRLLALARRTREIPELAFGSAFLLLGVVGYPLSIAARAADREVALAVALATQNLACLAIYLGTWRTFRPQASWAPCLFAAAVLACVASLAGQALSVGGFSAHGGGGWYYLGFAARAGSFAWAAVESLTYWRRLRRRLVLGLADPVVTDRLRLWSISTLSITAAFGLFLWGRVSTANVAESPLVLAGTSLVSIVGGVSMWLAFFPPARYVRRLLAGTNGADAPGGMSRPL
jgi:hypothetical protein